MSFINKLHETHEVFDKLNDLILSKSDKVNLKKHLLSISEDLRSPQLCVRLNIFN